MNKTRKDLYNFVIKILKQKFIRACIQISEGKNVVLSFGGTSERTLNRDLDLIAKDSRDLRFSFAKISNPQKIFKPPWEEPIHLLSFLLSCQFPKNLSVNVKLLPNEVKIEFDYTEIQFKTHRENAERFQRKIIGNVIPTPRLLSERDGLIQSFYIQKKTPSEDE